MAKNPMAKKVIRCKMINSVTPKFLSAAVMEDEE